MAEKMDAVRENEDRSNDTATQETATKEVASQESASPTAVNAAPEKKNAAPKYAGLRGKIGKNVGGKENAGKNASTSADGKENEKGKSTEGKSTELGTTEGKSTEGKTAEGSKKGEEKEARTKGEGDKKKPEEQKAPESEGPEEAKDDENVKTPPIVASNEAATPNKSTWKELRAMMNEKSFLTLSYKVQLSPTFFNTICPSNLAGKEEVSKLLQTLKANDATFGADTSFEGRQAGLQQMLETSQLVAAQVQTALSSSQNALQRTALSAYLSTIQNFARSISRKMANDAVIWTTFFGSSTESVEFSHRLGKDKDYTDKFMAFSKTEQSHENVEAYLALRKSITPKKFMFDMLYKGLKDDAATIDKLLSDPKMRSSQKYLVLNVPNAVLTQLLEAYKAKKMGDVKKIMQKDVLEELTTNITDIASRFSASNPTADKL
jgi:hypothetical protein